MTQVFLEFLHRSGILAVPRLFPRRHLLVLNFHRVRDTPSHFHDGLIEVKSKAFREHLEWLGKHATFIGESDLPLLKSGGRPKILLTFDDGYRDSHHVIAPILESLGIPAIFFVAPGVLDSRTLGPWDRIAYLVKNFQGTEFRFRERLFSLANDRRSTYLTLGKWSESFIPDQGDEFVEELAQALRLRPPPIDLQSQELLSWAEVRDLHRRGFAIGGHGYSHRVLSSLSLEDQAEEMQRSFDHLAKEKLRPLSFSYPFGSPKTYSWETREAALAAGFQNVFSFSDRCARISGLDLSRIERVAFKSSVAKYNFLLSVPGIYNFAQAFRTGRNG